MLNKEIALLELQKEIKVAMELNQTLMALGISRSIEIIEDMEEQRDLGDLVNEVEEWSFDKGLNDAESSKQMLKVVEEVGEVAAALARNDMAMLKDGIGDVIVTLIILAQQNDTDIHECLDIAYAEIADRTGKMIDGVFVKSSDLK